MDGSLSLILPAYNEAAGIAEAVAEADDALTRFCADYEILVLDGGSRDGPGAAAGHGGGRGGRAAPAAAARRQQGVAGRHPADARRAAAVLVVAGALRRRRNLWDRGTEDRGQKDRKAVFLSFCPLSSVPLA